MWPIYIPREDESDDELIHIARLALRDIRDPNDAMPPLFASSLCHVTRLATNVHVVCCIDGRMIIEFSDERVAVFDFGCEHRFERLKQRVQRLAQRRVDLTTPVRVSCRPGTQMWLERGLAEQMVQGLKICLQFR